MGLRDEIYRSQGESWKPTPLESIAKVGATAAVGYLTNKFILNSKIPGTKIGNLKYANRFTMDGKPWYEALGKAKSTPYTVKQAIWNAMKATEEMLGKMPRAFSLSSIYGRGILSGSEFQFTQEFLEKNISQLSVISDGNINSSHLGKNLFYKDNKIWLEGSDEPLLKRAQVMPGQWNIDEKSKGRSHSYTARFPEAHFKMNELKPSGTDFIITGGKNRAQAFGRDLNAFSTVAMQNYVKLLDDPFELVSNYIGKGIVTETGSKAWAKFMLKDMFGVGGYQFAQSGSGAKLLKKHALRGLPVIGAGMLAYKGINSLLRSTVDTTLGGMGAQAYQDVSMGVTGLSDVSGLTSLSKWQEEQAPGSTSLLGNLSFAGSAAIFGATSGGLLSLAQGIEIGEKLPAPALFTDTLSFLEGKSGKIGQVFEKLNLSSASRTGAFAAMGAAVGLLAAAPFLLGSLGSSVDTGELSDIYEGKQQVDVRRGRFWEFGTSPFEGRDIEYFAPHWTVRAKTDAGMKGRLPEEYYDNPLRMAVDRLFDPYAIERKLDEERPYTYWGSTDYGFGFIERMFKPLKDVFKPTILAHPEGIGGIHPSQSRRGAVDVATSMQGSEEAVSTSGFISDPITPDSLQSYVSKGTSSLKEMFGLQGFAIGGLLEGISGDRSFITPNAEYESSGRILSAQRSYWEEAIGGAFGMCFLSGSKVKTMIGRKNIEDINEGDYVLSKNTYKKVIALYKNKISSQLLNIESKSSGVDIKCTSTHKIPTLRRHEYTCGHKKPFNSNNYSTQEVEAGNIIKGDYLYYQIDNTEKSLTIDLKGFAKTSTEKYVYYQASIEFALGFEAMESNPMLKRSDLRKLDIPDLIAKEVLRQFKLGMTPKRIKRFIDVDEDLSYAIGWFIAEGNTDSGRIQYTMHANELEYANKIATIFNRYNINSSITIDENTLILRVNSSAFARYFKLFGSNAHNKHIPLEYKQLPKLQTEQLLNGLILGDGWDNGIDSGFTSVSSNLVADVYDISLKLKRPSNVNIDYIEIPNGTYPQGSKRKHTKRSYLRYTKNRESWRFFDGSFLIPVTNIENINEYHEFAYDIHVDDIHYYTVSGVVVHNSEAYRRLNSHREYSTEYVSAPIKNLMPSWIPEGGLQYGDPYSQLKHGELRLPGRGYEALHPELEGVDFEDYPLVHRMNILNSVASGSPEFYEHKSLVEQQIYDGNLNEGGEDLFNEVMRQRKEVADDYPFDNQEGGIVGDYYLKLKQLGRSLPTESLYPISPVHKFAGPVDPISEYKSFNLLDKQFKLWQHPIDDFIMPAINKSISGLSLVDYVPASAAGHADIESYFSALQYSKNQVLDQKAQEAADSENYEAASFFQSGKRKTIHGSSPLGDVEELASLLPQRQQAFLRPMLNMEDRSERQEALNIVAPEMQQILSSQWDMQDRIRSNGYDNLDKYRKSAEPISGMSDDPIVGGNMPDKDFIGYAPGVDLNAFKLKVVNNMGKNIRDFSLWREDERNAQVLDSILRNRHMNMSPAEIPGMDRDISKRALTEFLTTSGMKGARITATPIRGNQSMVDMNMSSNNEGNLKNQLREDGWITF